MPRVVGNEVREMFGSIAERYDSTNTILSFGIHYLWRSALLRSLPREWNEKGRALDLCTGTADVVPLLKRRYGSVIGVDFCFPMLAIGHKKLKMSDPRSPLLQGDALTLPFRPNTMDCVTVAFGVRNLEDLLGGLKEMQRVLKQGGELRVLEFGQPSLPGLREFYRFYSKSLMPVIGGTLTGNREAYRYLPETSAAFPCGARFCEILSEAGFQETRSKSLSGGIAYLYSAVKGFTAGK